MKIASFTSRKSYSFFIKNTLTNVELRLFLLSVKNKTLDSKMTGLSINSKGISLSKNTCFISVEILSFKLLSIYNF